MQCIHLFKLVSGKEVLTLILILVRENSRVTSHETSPYDLAQPFQEWKSYKNLIYPTSDVSVCCVCLDQSGSRAMGPLQILYCGIFPFSPPLSEGFYFLLCGMFATMTPKKINQKRRKIIHTLLHPWGQGDNEFYGQFIGHLLVIWWPP